MICTFEFSLQMRFFLEEPHEIILSIGSSLSKKPGLVVKKQEILLENTVNSSTCLIKVRFYLTMGHRGSFELF